MPETTTPAGRPDAASVRPVDGSCSHWIGPELRYCREADGCRYFREGYRCPAHTPNAVKGMPEPPPGPGIPAYRKDIAR